MASGVNLYWTFAVPVSARSLSDWWVDPSSLKAGLIRQGVPRIDLGKLT